VTIADLEAEQARLLKALAELRLRIARARGLPTHLPKKGKVNVNWIEGIRYPYHRTMPKGMTMKTDDEWVMYRELAIYTIDQDGAKLALSPKHLTAFGQIEGD
jgi:hypothetical protein